MAAIYLIVGAVFAIPAFIKWRHLRAPLEITPGSPPHFGGHMSGTAIESVTGVVAGSSARSDTSVYGQAQGGSGLVSSYTIVTNSFRLVDPQTHQERNIQVEQMNLQLYEGQVASVVWVFLKGKDRGRCLMVVNHTSGQTFFNKQTIAQIHGLGSPIVFALYGLVNFWNVIAWVAVVVWLRRFVKRRDTFMSSGVDPLVKSLNETAARLTPA